MSPNERVMKPANRKGTSNPFSVASLLLEDESEVELDLDTVIMALTRTASNNGCHSVDTAPSGPDVASEPGSSAQQKVLPDDSSETVVTHASSSSSENGGQPHCGEGKTRLDVEGSLPKAYRVASSENEIKKSSSSPLEQSDQESDLLSASLHPDPPVLQTSQNFLLPGAFRMTTSWSADYGEEDLPPPPTSLVATCTQATISTSQGSDYIVEASLVMDIDDDESESDIRYYNKRKEIALVEAKLVTDDNGCKTSRILRLLIVILIVTGSAVGITLGLAKKSGTSDSRDTGNPVPDGIPDNDGPPLVNQTSEPPTMSYTPTQTPTFSAAPTASPTAFLTYFRSVLPNATLDALEDEHSPQYLAYQWVSDHPVTGENAILRMTQRFAMAALYFATGGENWDKNDDWLNASAHECTWYFHPDVESACLEDTDTIVGVGLVDNGLRGTIPPELMLLSSLEVIMIETNPELSGSLPGSIHKLSSLTGLFLTDNELTGKLPTLSPATEILFVWQNNFDSSVPRSYSRLTTLDVFEARSNHLTGTFNEDIFGNWSVVSWLDIGDNKIRGSISASLGKLESLTTLDMSVNELTGTIPTEIGRLTAGLLDLNFGGNTLTGTIPSHVGKLTRLTSLDLYGNALTGTIPSELGKLKTVEMLYLEANSLTGPLPKEFAALERVENLYVYGNHLNGTIPSEIGTLPSVILLHLEENSFSGSIPRELGNLSTVVQLWLNSNRLIHTIPTELGQLERLSELYLNDNVLTGGIPSELGDLTSLTILHLHNNNVNGTVPESLCTLVESQNLDLRIDCDKVSCDCGCSCENSTTGKR